MAIYRNSSRYRSANGGIVSTRVPATKSTYYQYISGDGESFESLASKLLGDGTRYWEIADLNPQVKWPNQIPSGTVLRLPI